MRKIIYLTTFIIIAISCGRSADFQSGSFNTPDSATHHIIQEFRFTQLDENDFLALVTPKIHRLTDSTFLVLNRDRYTAYEFDFSENRIHTIGREGKGPGEFLSIVRSIYSHDNRLHLFDQLNLRHTILTKSGAHSGWEFVESRPYIPIASVTGLTDLIPYNYYERNDNTFQGIYMISPSSVNDTLSGNYAYTNAIDEDFNAISDPIHYRKVRDVAIYTQGTRTSMGVSDNMFAGWYFFNINDDEILYLKNNSNLVTAIPLNGDEYIKGELPYYRFKTDKEKVEGSVLNLRNVDDKLADLISGKSMPHEPYYQNVQYFDHQLWITLSTPEETKPNFIISELDGEIKRSLIIPKDFRLLKVMSDERIIGFIRDEDDVNWLIGYSIKETL